MIEYLIGVDGGGTGTRVRLAGRDGAELACGSAGPSALAHGIGKAWTAIGAAIDGAFGAAGLARPANDRIALGAGLSGVHNKAWAAQFEAVSHGFAALCLGTDAYTTLLGAHGGRPGCIVALGTGSVGEALYADGRRREVGGWGFPAGDEAGGGWIGLKAINHAEHVLDGRAPGSPFADALIAACGGGRDAVQLWLAEANQTRYASLTPIVVAHAGQDGIARAILEAAGAEAAKIARALDGSGTLPLALCGGLAEPLRPYLPAPLRERARAPLGDSAAGALHMIAGHLENRA